MGKYENEIYAYALRNSIEFGKCDVSKILPKLFVFGLQKGEIKEVMPEVNEIVSKVNGMKDEEKKGMFEKYKGFLKEKVEEEKGLPELPNVSAKSVFRMAPFPSGALHIGNAKTYTLNALYSEKYKGTTLLVMDDTIGSEEKQPIKEAYDLIEQGFAWLGIKYKKPVIYKSDRLKIYYDYAEQLIRKKKAYVCHCTQDILRENRIKGIECACRELPTDVQMKRWNEMPKVKMGSAVLRIKTDMRHPNPAFRDRVLFKISDREHPRVGKKYRVWPTLEMSWAIDDHLLGITHIIRGNDLAIETDMEKYIWDIFGWKHPECIHTGLVRIEGVGGGKLSKSKAQNEVKSGEFTGWDDPRTWSLQSLKRRGIMPDAFRKFVEDIGLNKQDINIPIDTLYSLNRQMIDSTSSRYSFVEDPVKLDISGKPKIEIVDVPIHPDKKGIRSIPLVDIYISNKDLEANKGKEVRLLHLYNISINKSGKKIEYTSTDNKPIPKIQWVSMHSPTRILMPSGVWISGYAEMDVSRLKTGQVIQFERVGFCRFDALKDGVCEFWFGHR